MDAMKRLVLILLLVVPGLARADLEFVVNSAKTQAKPIAIVPFAGNDPSQTDVAGIIEADLNRSGLFRTLARGDMLERPTEPGQVDFRNWRAVNMEDLVIGKMAREAGSDRMSTRFFLLDVYRGEQLIAYDMPPVAPDQLRYVAHQIADLIFERLTGIPGIFNTKIAYVASSGFGPSRTYQLLISDADGFNPRTIASSRETLMSPAWSPDRKKLAYVAYERGRSGIYVHDIATGVVKRVISEKGINGSPAWSPDGTQLAITLSYETNPDIYILDVASGRKRRITDHYGIDTEPAFSPDGQSIVFTSDRGGQPQLYRTSVNGGDAQRITFQGKQNLRASFAPDGKSLALVNVDNSSYRIALLDLASGNLRILSDGNMDESPSFAPNGAVIIYATQKAGAAELATVTTDGRVKQRLRQPGDVREPAWSPLSR